MVIAVDVVVLKLAATIAIYYTGYSYWRSRSNATIQYIPVDLPLLLKYAINRQGE